MRWKPQLLNLTPYIPGKSIESVKKEFGLSEITKLASNENTFGSSEDVKEAVRLFDYSHAIYPDGYATTLRESLAALLEVEQNQLIFGNGSDEVIQMISRALLHPGSNTIMADPTFPQYRHNAVLEGAEIREVPLVDGEHDLDSMLEAIDSKTNVIWVCSPNNPTGTYIPDGKLKSFLSQVPEDILVVLDEAYYEYAVAEDYYDAIKLLQEYKNLIVLRTFSKIYGLASFRLGYGISNAEIIKALEPAREPFNTNTLAQAAGIAALSDQQFVDDCRKSNREGLQQFYEFCKQNDLSYFPSQGNFILIDFKTDGDEVFKYLMSRGYIVRSGKALGFPTSIRVTVGSSHQNTGVMKAISEYLETTKS